MELFSGRGGEVEGTSTAIQHLRSGGASRKFIGKPRGIVAALGVICPDTGLNESGGPVRLPHLRRRLMNAVEPRVFPCPMSSRKARFTMRCSIAPSSQFLAWTAELRTTKSGPHPLCIPEQICSSRCDWIPRKLRKLFSKRLVLLGINLALDLSRGGDQFHIRSVSA